MLALQQVTDNNGFMDVKGTPPMKFAVRGKKKSFLRALAQVGRIDKASEKSGVSQSNHYYWLKNDPQYEADYQEAREIAADNWEDELSRRAFEGTTRQTGWHKGVAGGTYQEYDTTAGIFLLKGARPSKYGDHSRVSIDVNDNRSVSKIEEDLQRLLQQNPALLEASRTKLVTNNNIYIDEGGVGTPTRGVSDDIDPLPCSSELSSQNTSITGSDDSPEFIDMVPVVEPIVRENYSSIRNWSKGYDCCVNCGTVDRNHAGKGLCTMCYTRKGRGKL